MASSRCLGSATLSGASLRSRLALLDRLPVNAIGAVLNGVELTGEFQHYSYASRYSIDDANVAGELAEDTCARRITAGRLVALLGTARVLQVAATCGIAATF